MEDQNVTGCEMWGVEDAVQLNSGGPEMIVEIVVGSLVTVSWLGVEGRESGDFTDVMLRRYPQAS